MSMCYWWACGTGEEAISEHVLLMGLWDWGGGY